MTGFVFRQSCASLRLRLATFFLIAQDSASAPRAAKPRTPDELDSLVAPIALYPDPLLARVLAASTYWRSFKPDAGSKTTRLPLARISPESRRRSRGTPVYKRWLPSALKLLAGR